MDEATKALPCPFCGSDCITTMEGSTFRWRLAYCMDCGAQAGEVRHNTVMGDQMKADAESKDQAIVAWNRRVQSPKEDHHGQ